MDEKVQQREPDSKSSRSRRNTLVPRDPTNLDARPLPWLHLFLCKEGRPRSVCKVKCMIAVLFRFVLIFLVKLDEHKAGTDRGGHRGVFASHAPPNDFV